MNAGNGRLYDAKLGRFLAPDNFVQSVFNTQSYNRYGYVLNNPLMYSDPSGECVLLAIGIGILVGAGIDYGIQVASNYALGYRGKDAWVNKVDFFDVAVSGVISGLTAGLGTAVNMGKGIGKFGMFVMKNPKLITSFGIGLTSAVDITGEGVQPVTFKQFGQRVVTGIAVQHATNAISKALKGKSKAIIVTPDGVALPKGAYIPKDYIENPFKSGSYGVLENGKFVEKLRIDVGTLPGFKGPQRSHFHLNGGKEHIFDLKRWPWWL